MNETPSLPFKSVAIALLFCAALGPVGLLYSSFLGGVIMILAGFFIFRAKLIGLLLLVWLISCILGVAAVNRYNAKILKSHHL
ncbi:MAG: hypothetical protein ACD_60C00005G0011 [uncultured bacterium]|nr:MAG: hypothetical protein ACD_60C00005G0011 [uncultured bacterium]